MPAGITQSRLGIYYVDVDEGGISTRGNSKPLDTAAPPWLIETPAALADFADYSDDHNIKLTIYDRWGWPLIASRALQDPALNRDESWTRTIQTFVLGVPNPDLNLEYAKSGRETSRDIVNALRGLPESSLFLKNDQLITRYATPIDSDAGVGVMGVVVAEQPLPIARLLSADVFQELLLQTAIAFILVASCLIGFTILLGQRIRRIDSHVAEAMLTGGGNVAIRRLAKRRDRPAHESTQHSARRTTAVTRLSKKATGGVCPTKSELPSRSYAPPSTY